MNFSWHFLFRVVMPQLLSAIPVTLALTGIAALGSALLAIPLAVALGATRRCWRWPAQAYSLLLRGTPMLVQIYMIYYGLGSLIPRDVMRHSWASPLLRNAFWYGVIALTLNEAAYVGVILRGGLDAVATGQSEAAAALGLTRRTTLTRILLPQAVGVTYPLLQSECILLLKSTVLVSTITIFDVMGRANNLRFETLRIDEPLLGAGLVYVTLVGLLSLVSARIDNRLSRHR